MNSRRIVSRMFGLLIIISFCFIFSIIVELPVKALGQIPTSAFNVIGQQNFTSAIINAGDLSQSLNFPTGAFSYENHLYVADVANNRVLVYNGIPGTQEWDNIADYVIGQPDFASNVANNGGISATSLNKPSLVYCDNGHVYVSDTSNHRILVYNGLPGSSEWDNIADYVIGQPNFTSNTANNGGVSATSLYNPMGIFSDSSHVYVGDVSNNRVLVYNGIPGMTEWNNEADYVIGQPNFTSNTANNGGISASSLYSPRSIYNDGAHVYITDTSNHRVLVYDGTPGTPGWDTVAEYVIGQPNFTSGTANNGGVSATSLYNPLTVQSDGAHVYVDDYTNSRVLIYNGKPGDIGWDSVADYVMGQPDFTSSTRNNGGVNSSSLYYPNSAYFDGNNVYIADYANHRVLIYNGEPGEAGWDNMADYVIGQSDFTKSTINGGSISVSSLNYPNVVYSDGVNTYAADMNNNRVLVYNGKPGEQNWNTAADYVIGQPNFTSGTANNGGVNASSLYGARAVYHCANELYVVDYYNNRVLVYNGLPRASEWDNVADYVIGQPDFTSSTANNGGISASSMYLPTGVFCDDNHVYVADYGNSRVLVYNGTPGANGWDNIADYVIGQPNFTSNAANNGGINASSLSAPRSVFGDGSHIYVTDGANNRVLVYDGTPGSPGWDNVADYVIGQPNFTSNTANNGGISASSMNLSMGIYVDSTHVYVTEASNNRVLIYNGIPGTSGWDNIADYVIGQPNFTSNTANNGGISASSLAYPRSVLKDGNNLYIADCDNNRILSYKLGPSNIAITGGATASTATNILFVATDAKDLMLSEDANFSTVMWQNYATVVPFDVSPGDGAKTVYVKMRDYAGFESSVYTTTVTLDTQAPTGSITINNGASYATKNVTLNLSATDATTTVTHMMISNNNTFSGATWEPFAVNKSWVLQSGDGLKTVYVKYKDSAGNESSVYSDSIILDTVAPTTVITNLGLITNIPNKTPLFFYFTSHTPHIKGTSEANSTVHFQFESQDYTTTVDSTGHFDIILPKLPRAKDELTYYAIDQAGNKGIEKKLILIIGVENFPQEEISIKEPTVSPSGTVTPTPTVSTVPSETPTITFYAYTVKDQNGTILPNVSVTIQGQTYTTDSKGKVYLETELTDHTQVTITKNGTQSLGYVLGTQKVIQLQAVNEQRAKTSNWWLWIIVLIVVISTGVFIGAKRRKVMSS